MWSNCVYVSGSSSSVDSVHSHPHHHIRRTLIHCLPIYPGLSCEEEWLILRVTIHSNAFPPSYQPCCANLVSRHVVILGKEVFTLCTTTSTFDEDSTPRRSGWSCSGTCTHPLPLAAALAAVAPRACIPPCVKPKIFCRHRYWLSRGKASFGVEYRQAKSNTRDCCTVMADRPPTS